MTWLSDKTLQQLRTAAEMPDLSGTGYRLLERVGHGGMGVVWLAVDEKLDRRIALKVLDMDHDREARILARLEHPGIVPIHDVGRLGDGRIFYAMKYVEGGRLDERLPRIATLAERLRIELRICEAVAFAHARGVLHLDLKPANIMLGAFGEVLVMDWGLAMFMPDRNAHGVVAGTAGYMAPEQARGESAELNERADVYSLGAILRFMVSGLRPDKPLRAIVDKAMAPDPALRYPDVTALAADITAYVDGLPVSAYPEGLPQRLRRFLRRHRLAVGLVLAYTVVRVLIHIFFGG